MKFNYPEFMAMVLEAEALITAQNQTAIPAPFQKMLKLRGGKGRLLWKLTPDGIVVVTGVAASRRQSEDPALKPFLNLLKNDIRLNPGQQRPVTGALVKRASGLVEGMRIDLDAPLDDRAPLVTQAMLSKRNAR